MRRQTIVVELSNPVLALESVVSVISPDQVAYMDKLRREVLDARDLSRKWAANPEDQLVDDNRFSSYHYSLRCSEAAVSSESNALEASNSKRDALLAENNARIHAASAQEDAENSKKFANASSASASRSETSAIGSANSAKAAKASEEAAALSETNSAISETNAADSAEIAAQAAEEAAGSEGTATTILGQVNQAKADALASAQASADSAVESAGSAGESRAAEVAATNGASAASSSAAKALVSEQNSKNSETAAAGSATAARQSEQNSQAHAEGAEASKTAAAGSAADALTSKNTSATNATTATQQADRSEREADRAQTLTDAVAGNLVPARTGKAGKLLGNDGTNSQWLDPPVALPDQSGADGKFLGSDGSVASWKDISIPPGVPVGSILPFYGSSAPMGWLGLTRGAKISKADYPALFKHLTDQRKAPFMTEKEFSTHIDPANNWHNGFCSGNGNENDRWMGVGITFYNASTSVFIDAIGGDVNKLVGKYVWRPGASVVIRLSRSVEPNIYNLGIEVLGGTFDDAKAQYGNPQRFNIYDSITDIPVSDTECYLPDAANNFIKGYEPSEARPMGTFEQDAIRNITGEARRNAIAGFIYSTNTGGYDPYLRGAFKQGTLLANTTTSNSADGHALEFDASLVVPTGPENVPRNLNCLWIIKAYDAVNDPEQLQAKAVIDQVNSNSSDILAINGELDRIGYALLDFGTVNINSRYVQPNPFGNNTPVISIAEIQNNGKFANTGWIYSTGSKGSFGVKGSYLQNEGIVVQTGNIRLGDLPATTGTANDNSLVLSAPCRVHVWRVKG